MKSGHRLQEPQGPGSSSPKFLCMHWEMHRDEGDGQWEMFRVNAGQHPAHVESELCSRTEG